MLGVTMGNTTRTAGMDLLSLLRNEEIADMGTGAAPTALLASLDDWMDGSVIPTPDQRAEIERWSGGRVPAAAWEVPSMWSAREYDARNVYRESVCDALSCAKRALANGHVFKRRTGCMESAVQALRGVLANVGYEDACAAMGREL